MKHLKIFFKAIKNNLIALIIFLLLWTILSFFFADYIVPSPILVIKNLDKIIGEDFFSNLNITIFRILIGFVFAFIFGSVIGILSFFLKIQQTIETTLILFQVLPGTILGIIFLLIFGQNSIVPISLIIALTTPLIAINTGNSLLKKNSNLENIIKSFGGKKRELIRDLYLPMLIPTIRSNFTLGLGFAIKIVILGEFIATDNGIGYLLNISKIYFNMNSVFFYLFVIISIMLLFQIIVNFIFILFFEKFLYGGK